MNSNRFLHRRKFSTVIGVKSPWKRYREIFYYFLVLFLRKYLLCWSHIKPLNSQCIFALVIYIYDPCLIATQKISLRYGLPISIDVVMRSTPAKGMLQLNNNNFIYRVLKLRSWTRIVERLFPNSCNGKTFTQISIYFSRGITNYSVISICLSFKYTDN